ncbi:hypothetical protein A9Q76_01270 [Arcobacter sp. 31_11_sub10_T18]|nr:hypothetical protein A9Q76_01270 [Arcobacter sp. 31_11_sub10_T18]
MQLLNYINNYFDKLKSFQKIEMVLIPIIIALLLVYNFPNLQKKVITNIQNINQDVYYFEVEKQKILKKLNNVHSIKAVRDIELYAKQLNVEMTLLKANKNNLSLEAIGELKPIFNFINFSENYNNYTKIEHLMLSRTQKDNEIKVYLDLSFAQVIRTEKASDMNDEIKNVHNPFILKVITPLPKLYAIVNEHVLINNKWLKQNDSFDGYKILKIYLDYVELESNNNVFKLRLFEEN